MADLGTTVKLVLEIVKLEQKLELRGTALRELGDAIHKAHAHEGSYTSCEDAVCAGIRLILQKTEK